MCVYTYVCFVQLYLHSSILSFIHHLTDSFNHVLRPQDIHTYIHYVYSHIYPLWPGFTVFRRKNGAPVLSLILHPQNLVSTPPFPPFFSRTLPLLRVPSCFPFFVMFSVFLYALRFPLFSVFIYVFRFPLCSPFSSMFPVFIHVFRFSSFLSLSLCLTASLVR